MERTITGFRLDDDGHWVARLDCHHGLHVRHQPPWQERPWTQRADGRTAKVGTTADCPKCEWVELPDGLVHDRTTPEWTADTLPRALRRDHRVASGVWGRVRVLDGSVRFHFTDSTAGAHPGPAEPVTLRAGDTQPIPPDRLHRLEPIGPVRLVVDFFVAPRSERPSPPPDPPDHAG